MKSQLQKLYKQLERVEAELDKCRTSVLVDGWQTQKHAKKSRKWDILAQQKMKIRQDIEDAEREQILNIDFYDLAGHGHWHLSDDEKIKLYYLLTNKKDAPKTA